MEGVILRNIFRKIVGRVTHPLPHLSKHLLEDDCRQGGEISNTKGGVGRKGAVRECVAGKIGVSRRAVSGRVVSGWCLGRLYQEKELLGRVVLGRVMSKGEWCEKVIVQWRVVSGREMSGRVIRREWCQGG